MLNKEYRGQAYQNYRAGMPHKMNAAQQGVNENTIRSWCMRYKWKQRVEDENQLIEKEKSVHLFTRRLQRMDA